MSARPVLTTLERIAAPDHTALLVVDMQNDFCAPGGYIERVMKKDASACRDVVQPINELLVLARAAQIPVLWLRANYAHESLPESMHAKLVRLGITDVCCASGTWGADWFGVRPASSEPVIEKHCYSGFMNTSLHRLLQERSVKTLVFCGVQTHVCVESTLRDAHSLGYYCVVRAECVGSHTPTLHEATLANARFLGDVTTVAELRSLWRRVH
jgi:ureidoacrylate peracid hydrolase